MTIKIKFGNYACQTNETLTQRIQFVYSPLNELFRSLHVLLNPRHHGMNIDWALEAQRSLTDDFFNQLHYFKTIFISRGSTSCRQKLGTSCSAARKSIYS